MTILSHLGLAVASLILRLYRRSNRNCSFSESFEKSGGHTFFSLKRVLGSPAAAETCVFLIVELISGLSANRRRNVGNMFVEWVVRIVCGLSSMVVENVGGRIRSVGLTKVR